MDPEGKAWDLDYSKPLLYTAIKDVVHATSIANVWSKASLFHLGAGIDGGDYILPNKKQLRQLSKVGDHRLAYWVDAVTQGSMN